MDNVNTAVAYFCVIVCITPYWWVMAILGYDITLANKAAFDVKGTSSRTSTVAFISRAKPHHRDAPSHEPDI